MNQIKLTKMETIITDTKGLSKVIELINSIIDELETKEVKEQKTN